MQCNDCLVRKTDLKIYVFLVYMYYTNSGYQTSIFGKNCVYYRFINIRFLVYMYYTHSGYQTSIFGKTVCIIFKFLRY